MASVLKTTRIWLVVMLFLTPAWPDEFRIDEAGQTNVFLDDSQAQVHMLLRPEERLLFCFPSENSGVGIWYDGELRYLPQSLSSVESPAGQIVSAQFQVENPPQIRHSVLGSIRTLRDKAHGRHTDEALKKARRLYEQTNHLSNSWSTQKLDHNGMEREQPGWGKYRISFHPSLSQAEKGDVVTVTAEVPFPKLDGLATERLLNQDFRRSEAGEHPRAQAALSALEFLFRQDKMMAGSWRFQTYFGRDTLISLSMLEPILTDEALYLGIVSVVDRLAPNGEVAHEEDIGGWADWRHLTEKQPRYSLAPVYDYKMIDDNLLLPVLLKRLKDEGRTQVLEKLMMDSRISKALEQNALFVRQRAREGAIRLHPGESTGDWRDSHWGLGMGVYPYSVNQSLLNSALQATDLVLPVSHTPMEHRTSYWKTLSPAELQSRLHKFLTAMPAEERADFRRLFEPHLERLEKPITFPVLSLNDDDSTVDVSHSDVGFDLFYGDLSKAEVERIAEFLELPFPLGIVSPVGPVVANPIFSGDTRYVDTLGLGDYHGMVVWSWQSSMIGFGLLRQAERHPELAPRLLALVRQLETAEEKAGNLANSELWALEIDGDAITARAYGTGQDKTESNALQLWSTVYPSLRYVRMTSGLK